MGEWGWESQEKNDVAKQLSQLKESLTLKIHGLVRESDQGVGWAESLNK